MLSELYELHKDIRITCFLSYAESGWGRRGHESKRLLEMWKGKGKGERG
jgi:hypothetical protein